MPKIVRFHQIGGPENLKFDELPSAKPGQGEVRIRVNAAGLNRAESMFYRAAYIEQPQLPARLGYEVAGVVEAVGEGVDESWLGKKVATIPAFSQNRYGTLGEEAIVPAAALGEYPAKLSAIEASAIWMQYCRRQIEMSAFLPSRSDRFSKSRWKGHVRLMWSGRGRARADAKGRSDGAGSEESAQPFVDHRVGKGFFV